MGSSVERSRFAPEPYNLHVSRIPPKNIGQLRTLTKFDELYWLHAAERTVHGLCNCIARAACSRANRAESLQLHCFLMHARFVYMAAGCTQPSGLQLLNRVILKLAARSLIGKNGTFYRMFPLGSYRIAFGAQGTGCTQPSGLQLLNRINLETCCTQLDW